MAKPRTLGVMIDMSRNAVMSMDGLRRFLPLLKKMGYNCVMLYTEDTYEVEGEPFFGYMRGRYSKAELRELDAYAASLGIELIPCIQTLAHLYTFLRWGKAPADTNDILLVDEEKTYEFIDKLFASMSESISSRKIHIGMDEAHMLGRGKHLDLHGYENVSVLMKRHLDRVCEIAKKYNYEPMIWSDMFFRPWNDGEYCTDKTEVPKEYIDAVHPDVIPVYWDYYRHDEKIYDVMIENHLQISKKTWFAGGIWSWAGMIPANELSLYTMIPALNSCKNHKIKDIFFTMWGDDGAECSHFSQLPALFYLAQYAKGNTDEESIKRKFKSLIGIDFDEFMQIDEPNFSQGNRRWSDWDRVANPSKYMLFSDYFIGYLDCTLDEKVNYREYYTEMSKKLCATAKKSRRYGYVFDAAAKLCDVLTIKYDLGVRTRAAYKANDKDELLRLASDEYARLPKLIDIYARSFERQWFTDNKPYGFELQDARLGGLIRRTDACRRRILDYVNGKIDRIDELEEELLQYEERGLPLHYNNVYKTTTTAWQVG